MTHRNTVSLAALLFSFLMFSPLQAAAQEARSFEQLQLLVKPGDRIFITDSLGKVTEGKVAGLTASSLRLTTKGSVKDWAESDVLKIRQWRHDSLKNGTIIGASIGLGLGVLGAFALCSEWNDCGGEAVAIAATYAGIGAGVGVGIDALIPAKQTVYFSSTRTAVSRLKIKPIVGNAHKGAAVAFSF